MTKLNHDQQATVRWIIPTPGGYSRNGRERPFDTLRDGIRFVMKELPDEYRGTAFIDFGGGTLEIEAIEAEYAIFDRNL